MADDFQFDRNTQVEIVAWWGYISQEQHFTVKLLSDAAGRPGLVLTQFDSDITGKEVTDVYTPLYLYTVSLPAPLAVQADTRYWLSVSTPDWTKWAWILSEQGNSYSAVRRDGESWTSLSWDVAFAINVIPTEVPEPPGILLAGLGALATIQRLLQRGTSIRALYKSMASAT